MALRLYNTLSGKVEEFRPLVESEVRMYACGPTVYDYGHIGNLRTFIAVDILRRFPVDDCAPWVQFALVPEVVQVRKACSLEASGVENESSRHLVGVVGIVGKAPC